MFGWFVKSREWVLGGVGGVVSVLEVIECGKVEGIRLSDFVWG